MDPSSEMSASELSNKKLAAGLLGIFLGCFGVHKFVLGYTNSGIIMLAVSIGGGLITCGIASFVIGVIGLVEGIIYLTKSDAEFRSVYVDGRRPWF
jgi:TM2 domain-containing membrane protein YozV